MQAFKAYDIRGIYNKDFTKEDVYRIGFFLKELLNANKIAVGRDVRESSPEIFAYLSQGIKDSGAMVYDLGICTTPMVYWATAKFDFPCSVMITASHNPKEYNGLKISRENALPVGYDTGLSVLERWLKERRAEKLDKSQGELIEFDIKDQYLDFQKQFLADYSGLNISLDCSNGMASLFARKLYGSSVHYLFEELDGSFPNHEANPLLAENRIALQEAVIKNKSDIGIIFDGDADRVMFLDENACFISPDLMIAVLAHYFLGTKSLKGRVLQDIRSSKSVGLSIAEWGSEIYMWKVGRAFAAQKLREIDGIFGGELAGHYYFRDFYYSDSGLMACSIILGIIAQFKKEGIKLSQLIKQINKFANTGELNFRISQKQKAMDDLKDYFTVQEEQSAFYDFDGYRIEFKNWWFNIRASNTEPYLRLIIEADSEQLLEVKKEMAIKILSKWED